MSIQPLENAPSLSERAYRVIRNAILSLELRPGEFLSIGDLARQLQISRTPVRDALLLLENEGLVNLLPHKGALVSKITVRDLEEIWELRILLEGYAARVAAQRLTAADQAEIEHILAESECAIKNRQHLLASDLGRSLHDLLVQKVDNRRFADYLEHLDVHYTRIRRLSALVPGRLDRSHQEHRQIIEALKSGNSDQAENAMRSHLLSVRDEFAKYIEEWLLEINEGGNGVDAERDLNALRRT